MAGQQTRMVWALVFLLGLLATHFLVGQGTLTTTMALWVWFVLFIVANYSIGKTYGRLPASVTAAWMGANVVFIVAAGTMLLGLWSGGAAVLFALALLFNGGALFASGHELKKSAWLGWGLTNVALAIVFPAWFAGAPFFAAALLIGLPMVVAAWQKVL